MELLDKAINILYEYSNIEETISRGKSLTRMLDELESSVEELEALVEFTSAFTACCAGLDLTPSVGLVESIYHLLNEMLLKLDDAALESPELNRLSSAIHKLNVHLRVKWEEFVRRSCDDVLELLEVVIPLVGDPSRAWAAVSKIKNFLEKWPVSPEDVSSFTQAITEGKKIIASLNVDNKIRNFLILVANGNASLADLDDDVMNWVKKHRLESRIAITFRGRSHSN